MVRQSVALPLPSQFCYLLPEQHRGVFVLAILRLPVFAFLLTLFWWMHPSQAEDNPLRSELLIQGAPQWWRSSQSESQPAEDSRQPFQDFGRYLRSVPAVTGGRIGGHGIEPVIRGQSQNQLNITADGAFSYGACPNRMDPPSALIDAGQTHTRVRVTRGYESVLQGPGGPGGSIAVESLRPDLNPESPLSLRARSSIESNGGARGFAADGDYSQESWFLRGNGFWTDANNYQDGAGDTVRSAYRTNGGGATIGWNPMEESDVVLSWQRHRTTDALFAGAGMDSPLTEADTWSLRTTHTPERDDIVRNSSFNVFTSRVDHLMDNYSLRPRASSFMRVPAQSRTTGGRATVQFAGLNEPLSVGLDFIENNRDARRYASPMNAAMVNGIQSILWPDITIQTKGFFIEAPFTLSHHSLLTLGTRYDRVSVDWAGANLRPDAPPSMAMMSSMSAGPSPNDLYQDYYGERARYLREEHVGGTVRLEHHLTSDVTLSAGVARAFRTADATERGIASDMGMERWIGNPSLNPEQHDLIEVGVSTNSDTWHSAVRLFYDSVEDFILRDRARGQSGVLRNDQATIYRNIDATITGVETEVGIDLSDQWHLLGDISFTYGEDRDRDAALPQIPPLFGSIRCNYTGDRWEAGTTISYALQQNRVDRDPLRGTGRDVRATPGYAILDLYATAAVSESVNILLGISNLFDTRYANHLNRSNSFDPEEIQVNEPGRSLFIELRARL